ncbi:MAG: zinc-binding dehydrogenase [Imperialibacter sp.]|uniref:zinc-binding dehydrogenase n=1 Tax=Imperialibacter sp. TaxID=2038411 RepID=UPI0032EC4D55
MHKQRFQFQFANQEIKSPIAGLVFLKQLAEQGHYKPVVDRSFPLADIAEAHTYVASGRKVGNVAVVVCGGDTGG